MTPYEQLGLFYLGRRVDIATGARLPDPLLYDSKDLLTHAVCVGMTGSGKTGLGIGLIEEAAIDGIPVLAIDPKGDLSNLLLAFPDLTPAVLAPWIGTAAGGRQDTSIDTLAKEQADRWRAGLAEWDQAPERIGRFRDAARVRVLTPGSRAGTPLALLQGLRPGAGANEEDAAADIATTASSLLALAGIADAAPPMREHALVAAILASGSGSRADLPWLVQQIQRPAFESVGVIDLETFYPARDRQELALRFNSVLAAPGFGVWLEGEPLDIASLLYDEAGRPRVSVISIAHLGDAERMLVVSLLLNAVLAWTRRQGGTSSLRAIVYMDEVFGYLPPVANPPSKRPLLTLLKQARAFGVGLVLATQNPVDLDYKALSNAGTWFLGRLQTERDKARVLDGIEGLSSAAPDRAALDRMLSAVRSRVFLMHDVHEPEPLLFETRWTLSYLRGPMTREEIARASRQDRAATIESPSAAATSQPASASAAATEDAVRARTGRPVLPAGVHEAFIPSGPAAGGTYVPALYGAARIHYRDARRGVDHTAAIQALAPFREARVPVDWESAEPIDVPAESLLPSPGAADPASMSWGALPSPALRPKSYETWARAFAQWVQRSQPLRLMRAPALGLTSQPGESERDFRIRLQQAAHEARDAAAEKLRARYATRVQRVAARVRSAEEAVAREQQQAQQQKVQSAVSIGAAMLGALMGRRAVSISSLGRATTAARGVGRSMKEAQDVARATDRLAEAKSELAKIQQDLEAEIAALPVGGDIAIEPVEIAPSRGGVEVRLVTLVWKRMELA